MRVVHSKELCKHSHWHGSVHSAAECPMCIPQSECGGTFEIDDAILDAKSLRARFRCLVRLVVRTVGDPFADFKASHPNTALRRSSFKDSSPGLATPLRSPLRDSTLAPGEVAEFLRFHVADGGLRGVWTTEYVIVQVESKPFAKGAVRRAYRLRILYPPVPSLRHSGLRCSVDAALLLPHECSDGLETLPPPGTPFVKNDLGTHSPVLSPASAQACASPTSCNEAEELAKLQHAAPRATVTSPDGTPLSEPWLSYPHVAKVASCLQPNHWHRCDHSVGKVFIDAAGSAPASPVAFRPSAPAPIDLTEGEKQYFIDAEMQAIAKKLGEMFSNLKGISKVVDFLEAAVLRLPARTGFDRPNRTMALESYVPGFFEKFNSNCGFVMPGHATPQAFSHFTFESTRGAMIVVDVQGVDVLYTDPQFGPLHPFKHSPRLEHVQSSSAATVKQKAYKLAAAAPASNHMKVSWEEAKSYILDPAELRKEIETPSSDSFLDAYKSPVIHSRADAKALQIAYGAVHLHMVSMWECGKLSLSEDLPIPDPLSALFHLQVAAHDFHIPSACLALARIYDGSPRTFLTTVDIHPDPSLCVLYLQAAAWFGDGMVSAYACPPAAERLLHPPLGITADPAAAVALYQRAVDILAAVAPSASSPTSPTTPAAMLSSIDTVLSQCYDFDITFPAEYDLHATVAGLFEGGAGEGERALPRNPAEAVDWYSSAADLASAAMQVCGILILTIF